MSLKLKAVAEKTTSQIRGPVQVPAALLRKRFLVHVLGKAAHDCSSMWASATHTEGPDGPGF